MNVIKQMLLLSLICALAGQVSAQQLAGGEIYYRLIGPKKYLVTAHVYRQCHKSPLNQLNGFVVADSFRISMNFVRTSIQRINDSCGNPCNIQNTVSNRGYEKHSYTDTVDFNRSRYAGIPNSNLCQVQFVISQNARDTTYTTISHSTGLFYLEAQVNICLNFKQVRSPEFAFEPKFILACNQPMNYHPGPIDSSDFDSMSFDLVAPLQGHNDPVQYVGSLNTSIPMTPYCPPNPGVINCRPLPNAKPPRGFYFDREVCDIIFTPTKCDEIGAIKIRATEWRKDTAGKHVQIGYVCREMRLELRMLPDNNPPYFTGSNKYAVCNSNKLCFTISTKDDPFLPKQTIPDTVTLFWNHGIPSATCSITDSNAREKEMQFCWTAKHNILNPKLLIGMMAYDKPCNVGMSSRGYLINTKPKAAAHRKFTYSACNTLQMEAVPDDTVYYNAINYRYAFSVYAEDKPGIPLYTEYNRISQFKIPASGHYIIKLSFNNPPYNCPTDYLDTLYLSNNKQQIANEKGKLYCMGETVYINPNLQSDTRFAYRWQVLPVAINPVDTLASIGVQMDRKIKQVVLMADNGKACQMRDTFTLLARGGFDFTPFGKPLSVCRNLQKSIAAVNIKGTAPFQYQWTLGGQVLGHSDSAVLESFSAPTQLILQLTDSALCPFTDTLQINPLDPPVLGISDRSACIGRTIRIDAKVQKQPEKLSYIWTLDNVPTMQTDSFFSLTVLKNQLLKVAVSVPSGCNNEKTIRITANPLPQFRIVFKPAYNRYEYIQLSTDTPFKSYAWSNGRSTRINAFWAYELGAPGLHYMTCMVTDSNGCNSTEVISFRTDQFTGLSESGNTNLRIYPNPFQNTLLVESQDDNLLQLYAANGQLLISMPLGAGLNRIETADLPVGLYLICIGQHRETLLKH